MSDCHHCNGEGWTATASGETFGCIACSGTGRAPGVAYPAPAPSLGPASADAALARIWKALGIETYEQAGGKEISEIVGDAVSRIERLEAALEAIIDGSPMKEPQNLWLRKLTPDEAEDLGHDKARWEMAQIARAALADARANARVMPAHDPETGELPEEEPAERRPAPREEPRQRAAGQVPPPRTTRPQAGLAFGEEE